MIYFYIEIVNLSIGEKNDQKFNGCSTCHCGNKCDGK